MKTKIILFAVLSIFGLAAAYAVSVAIASVLNHGYSKQLLSEANTFKVFGALAILVAVGMVYFIVSFNGKSAARRRLLKGSEQRVEGNLENASFMTSGETEKKFRVCAFRELKDVTDGILLGADERKGEMRVTLAKPIHTLVVGTTGCGKTETFVNPFIRVLAETKTQPTMIISDPKGELLDKHGAALKTKGYKLLTLDLRNPYTSSRWNPLENLYLAYQRMLRLQDITARQILYSEIYEELSEIAGILSPVTNKNDGMWESGAKNFILSTMLAMLEDSENPANGMTVEKFNFYNVAKIAFNADNEYADLKTYFLEGRGHLSKARSLASQVLTTGDKTLKSYMTTIADKLQLFNDLGICGLTMRNDIDLSGIDEEPTAVFLLIPDERVSRHALATLFTVQAYNELVKKANTTAARELSRSCYFILDEFGNLPKLPNIENFITVGRSRRIFMVPVVQSFSQLDNKYGKDVANIIKSNCNIKIYIGTDDKQTNEEFSKILGNYSVMQTNVSQPSGNSLSVSDSIKERPLVYPSELAELNNSSEGGRNMGNSIVSMFGFKPLKGYCTPFFKATAYVKYNKLPCADSPKNGFDEQEIYYDIQGCKSGSAQQIGQPDIGEHMQPDIFDLPKSSAFVAQLADEVNRVCDEVILGAYSTAEEVLEAIQDELVKAESAGESRKVGKLLLIKRRLENEENGF